MSLTLREWHHLLSASISLMHVNYSCEQHASCSYKDAHQINNWKKMQTSHQSIPLPPRNFPPSPSHFQIITTSTLPTPEKETSQQILCLHTSKEKQRKQQGIHGLKKRVAGDWNGLRYHETFGMVAPAISHGRFATQLHKRAANWRQVGQPLIPSATNSSILELPMLRRNAFDFQVRE
jgi:hypothetical protein